MIINFILRILWRYNMVDLYVALIIAGRRTIDQVPVKFREAVIADLNALGLDENGEPMEDYGVASH
jgi:hypothetical protein